ncbi:uncharacterized protein RJT21DRAFT_111284 [Scheffersomyces amazonensis]|uniref:uncharacterized protein n=1 Tax=Scheffersomyces amazonensis TaxID=1078765 RepID=UPI00315DCE9B
MVKKVSFSDRVISSSKEIISLNAARDSDKEYNEIELQSINRSPFPNQLVDSTSPNSLVSIQLSPDSNAKQITIRQRGEYNVYENTVEDLTMLSEDKLIEHTNLKFNNFNLFWYCLVLSFTSFPLGWDVGTITNLINHASFTIKYLSSFKLGLVISSFILGSLVGCFFIPFQTNKHPLKSLLQFSTIIFLLGTCSELLFLKWAINYWCFIFGRFLSGIGCGSLCVIGPLYMNEILLSGFKLRGFYLSFWQSFVCLIILIGNIQNYYLNSVSVDMIYVHQVIKIFFVLFANSLIPILPHSPEFFKVKGDVAELRKIYLKILKSNGQNEIDNFVSLQNQHQLQSNDKHGYETNLSYVELFQTQSNKIIKCCFIMAFQQLTGINYFFYYGPIIFRNFKSAFIIMSLVNLIGSLLGGPIIHLWNIKYNLILSGCLMAILMTVYSLIGQFTSHLVPLIVLSITFIFFFAISWGPSCGILVNVIANNNPKIVSLSIGLNWLFNWIIITISPWMIQRFQFNYNWIFVASLISMTLFIQIFIPKNILG